MCARLAALSCAWVHPPNPVIQRPSLQRTFARKYTSASTQSSVPVSHLGADRHAGIAAGAGAALPVSRSVCLELAWSGNSSTHSTSSCGESYCWSHTVQQKVSMDVNGWVGQAGYAGLTG